MLKLVSVTKIDVENCCVVLDRDGKSMEYVFHVSLSPPADLPTIGPPEEAYYDLIDYDEELPPGTPQGAILIPFMSRLCSIVYSVASGREPVEFPIILDER